MNRSKVGWPIDLLLDQSIDNQVARTSVRTVCTDGLKSVLGAADRQDRVVERLALDEEHLVGFAAGVGDRVAHSATLRQMIYWPN